MLMRKFAFAALVALSVTAPLAASFADTAVSPSTITNATTESMTQQAIMNGGDALNSKVATPYKPHREHLDIDDIGSRERGW